MQKKSVVLPPVICGKCNSRMTKIDHYEPDGVTEIGSYEPYYECPFGCEEDEDHDKI